MQSIRSATKPVETDPAKLLFNHLATKCKDEKERAAAINRVISSPGGYSTVQDTLRVAEREAASINAERYILSTQFTNNEGRRGGEIEKKYLEKQPLYDLYQHCIRPELKSALEKFEAEDDLNKILDLSRQRVQSSTLRIVR